uniref:uncharacterized protein LOC118542226 isoform X11 n=1 Tax=Halichoerus grypus TaxID=9711 RepID=UPI0016590AC9|nr:uncharacterized protein LOC118542226 isoform X11 [Halichoerus grypus]
MLLRPTPHWLLENAPGMEAPRTCVWFSPLPKGPLPLLLGEGFGGGLPSGASACILPSPPRHVGLQRKNFRKATLCNKEGTSSGENALPVSKRREKGYPPTGRPDPGRLLALRQDTLPQPPSCLSRAQQPPRRESPPAFRRWRLRGETEAQRGEVICLRPRGWEDTEPQGKHRTRALPGGCAPQNPGCRPSLLSRPGTNLKEN